ncbi:MAG: DUF1624 domain-containing protein [Verrucomicrobia bacterium]|jgi:predicted acyltransferase|nr:DUF1624 domain-containing protein [Verrucomicrobiota bacterium]MBT5479901.1 DUF1624 domain-containing protein [Verrucomicrobiota bacterium]MBT6237196.1 DUF1624 domain-containing protein [Verrucomicrobiota bacterium]MBT6804370.1 DUF1624 domain-containing protein [Verrucomicrobiota bacterium]MBT7535345.1 DUF1624 domain-containing protein [Verrucomicrobiota bacterium]
MSKENATEKKEKSQRLTSLDALRGFDMFWIVGAEEVVHALGKSHDAGWTKLLADQLTHKSWEGFAFYDCIFPLFVFLAGVSMVFSLTRTIEERGKAYTLRKVFIRSLILYTIGIFYYGGFSDGVENIRLLGVLQRIALCYLFAAIIFCMTGLKGRVTALVVLLVGYWAMMTFIPVPGVGAGNFEEGKNLADHVDKMYLPLFKWNGDHDPEGLLSTLPAIGSCLLGVFAGMILHRKEGSAFQKTGFLMGLGLICLALGYAWSFQFPIIKNIWTSSFVLVAGGFSFLALGTFYFVIDGVGFHHWCWPFVWIGMNPITIYLAHNIVDLNGLANRFVGGPIKASLGGYAEALVLATVTAMSFLLVWFLHRKRIYLRV